MIASARTWGIFTQGGSRWPATAGGAIIRSAVRIVFCIRVKNLHIGFVRWQDWRATVSVAQRLSPDGIFKNLYELHFVGLHLFISAFFPQKSSWFSLGLLFSKLLSFDGLCCPVGSVRALPRQGRVSGIIAHFFH